MTGRTAVAVAGLASVLAACGPNNTIGDRCGPSLPPCPTAQVCSSAAGDGTCQAATTGGSTDGGAADGGAPDAGAPDAGAPDAGQPCPSRDNASVSEDGGVCSWACLPSFVDVNQDLTVDRLTVSNGCECAVSSQEDRPDETDTDRNCDGIVGDESKAIFVALEGDDFNPGTRTRPLKTLSAALQVIPPGIEQIYVAEGTWIAPIRLAAWPRSIFGGYASDAGWSRSKQTVTRLVVDGPTVEGLAVTGRTELQRLVLEVGDAGNPGESVYGIKLIPGPSFEDGGSMVLSDVLLVVGNAADGLPGVDHAAGLPGAVGASATNHLGATATATNCGAPGGGGGQGAGAAGVANATAGSQPPFSGGVALPGLGGVPGANASALNQPGQAGGDGGFGTDGEAGSAGAPTLSTLDYVNLTHAVTVGSNGSTGRPGAGGGGGGGAGGGAQSPTVYFLGGGGGAGGAGGCPGAGGLGGMNGGFAYGIFNTLPAGRLTLTRVVVQVGHAGSGGRGGNGGAPGAGGAGGLGFVTGTLGGRGGNGGRGGEGGPGGGGGGGHGGSVACLIGNAPAPGYELTCTRGVAGAPGPGGAAGNARGSAGTAGSPGASNDTVF